MGKEPYHYTKYRYRIGYFQRSVTCTTYKYNITSAALDDIVCSTSRMLLKIHTFELVSRGSCHHRCSQVRDSDSPDMSAQERYSAGIWERRLRQRDPPSGADKAAPISGAFLNWAMIGHRSPAAQPQSLSLSTATFKSHGVPTSS